MSLAAQITSTGILAPSYANVLSQLTASFQNIYGSDIYITPDSQDGQMIAIFAQAINDANQMAVNIYNSYSPATSQGVALSNNLKINGLQREVASNSTAVVTIIGQEGKTITNGVVSDSNGNLWNLPVTVNIPGGGSVSVTVTAQTIGSIFAAANTITRIQTPTNGWQSVNNPSGSTIGNPVETDAQARIRQSKSTQLAAVSVLGSMYSALGNVPSVNRFWIYENDTPEVDSNSAPPFSTYAVLEGGDTTVIATAIAKTKTPGSPTFGNTTEVIIDQFGMPNTIHFSVAIETTITVAITIAPLMGYVESTGPLIVKSIIDYIINNPININKIYISRVYVAAGLDGNPLYSTYNVTSLEIAIGSGMLGTSDLTLAYNDVATADTSSVTLTVS